jgi:hypothetical protein
MIVQKRNSAKQVWGKVRGLINPPNVLVKEAGPHMKIMRDAHIPVRDGRTLSANIYLPIQDTPCPILLCLHPGRKDKLCKDGYMHIQFRFARQPGQISFSDETSFEAPDPDFWVANGYGVINIDKCGFGISPRPQSRRFISVRKRSKTCTTRSNGRGCNPGAMAAWDCSAFPTWRSTNIK